MSGGPHRITSSSRVRNHVITQLSSHPAHYYPSNGRYTRGTRRLNAVQPNLAAWKNTPPKRSIRLLGQSNENLPRGVADPDVVVEHEGLSDSRVPKVALDVGQVRGCNVVEYAVKAVEVAFGDGQGDRRPWDGVGEGEADAVGNDDRDASEGHRLDQPRAPRRPSKRAEAEDRPGNLGLVASKPLPPEVEPSVPAKSGPYLCPDPPVKLPDKQKLLNMGSVST